MFQFHVQYWLINICLFVPATIPPKDLLWIPEYMLAILPTHYYFFEGYNTLNIVTSSSLECSRDAI